jgi:hypothetical protein
MPAMQCAPDNDGIGYIVCDVAPMRFARGADGSLLRGDGTRCRVYSSLGCFRTTRPRSVPKTSAFCTLYGLTGYCRMRNGRDPVYQRETGY